MPPNELVQTPSKNRRSATFLMSRCALGRTPALSACTVTRNMKDPFADAIYGAALIPLWPGALYFERQER